MLLTKMELYHFPLPFLPPTHPVYPSSNSSICSHLKLIASFFSLIIIVTNICTMQIQIILLTQWFTHKTALQINSFKLVLSNPQMSLDLRYLICKMKILTVLMIELKHIYAESGFVAYVYMVSGLTSLHWTTNKVSLGKVNSLSPSSHELLVVLCLQLSNLAIAQLVKSLNSSSDRCYLCEHGQVTSSLRLRSLICKMQI